MTADCPQTDWADWADQFDNLLDQLLAACVEYSRASVQFMHARDARVGGKAEDRLFDAQKLWEDRVLRAAIQIGYEPDEWCELSKN
jgi:hypothetical protein